MDYNFERLEVYQKSLVYVEQIYLITKKFPKDEVFGLRDQIRRSAISMPSNIAEGDERDTDKESVRFFILQKDPWPS